jgi:DNA-binding NtrC family response regulator
MVVPIKLPPLRERGEGTLLLARHFLAQYSQAFNKNFQGFSPEAERKLTSYPWPGNIRELKNVVERTVLLEDGSVLQPHQLHVETPKAGSEEDTPLRLLVRILEQGHMGEEGIPFEELVAEVEKELILRAHLARVRAHRVESEPHGGDAEPLPRQAPLSDEGPRHRPTEPGRLAFP